MNENSYLSKDCFTWQHTVQNGFNKETYSFIIVHILSFLSGFVFSIIFKQE